MNLQVQIYEPRHIIDLMPEDVEDVTPITVKLSKEDYIEIATQVENAVKEYLPTTWVDQEVDEFNVAGMAGILNLRGTIYENGDDVEIFFYNTTELILCDARGIEAIHDFSIDKLRGYLD